MSLRDLRAIQEEISSGQLETLRVWSSEKSCEVVMGVQKMPALNGGGSHGSGWEVKPGRRLTA